MAMSASDNTGMSFASNLEATDAPTSSPPSIGTMFMRIVQLSSAYADMAALTAMAINNVVVFIALFRYVYDCVA